MTQHVIAMFCGTGLQMSDEDGGGFDSSFNELFFKLRTNRQADNRTVLGYDGCQTEKKILSICGMNAYGTGEKAEQFVRELEKIAQDHPGENIKVNLIGHSRGCISAFKAVQRIQHNPLLRECVEIVMDMRDPVPGNIELTVATRNPAAVAVKIANLEDCYIIKKACFTLTTDVFGNNNSPGFDTIIPNFSPETSCEIEVLDAWHDTLQRGRSNLLFQLARNKSLQLVLENAASPKIDKINALKEQQLIAYKRLNKRSIGYPIPPRKIHYDGSIVYNKSGIYLNLRHQKLYLELNKSAKKNAELSIKLGISAPKNISHSQAVSLTAVAHEENCNKLSKVIRQVSTEISKIKRNNAANTNFAVSAEHLKHTWVLAVSHSIDLATKKGSYLNVTKIAAYQSLIALRKILDTLNNPNINLNAKLRTLISFENTTKGCSGLDHFIVNAKKAYKLIDNRHISKRKWQYEWDNAEGSAFQKAMHLLFKYSGSFKKLGSFNDAWGGSTVRFFSCQWNKYYGDTVQRTLGSFHNMDAMATEYTELQTIENLLAELKRELHGVLQKDGSLPHKDDLYYILEVIQEETNVSFNNLAESTYDNALTQMRANFNLHRI